MTDVEGQKASSRPPTGQEPPPPLGDDAQAPAEAAENEQTPQHASIAATPAPPSAREITPATTMEVNVMTFSWLRDCGILFTDDVVPSKTRGMLVLNDIAVLNFQTGENVLKLIRHYCKKHNFSDPLPPKPTKEEGPLLSPQSVGASIAPPPSGPVAKTVGVARNVAPLIRTLREELDHRRQNWSAISQALKNDFHYALPWEKRELILSGDMIETTVFIKNLQTIMKQARRQELKEREKHKTLCEDPELLRERELVEAPIHRQKSPVERPDHEKPWLINAKPYDPEEEKKKRNQKHKFVPKARGWQ